MGYSTTIDFSKEVKQQKYSAKYLYYLNEYNMRLRKPVGAPPNDAAGLLGGAKYSGRNTPLKGHGQPPAENREASAPRGHQTVHGHSWQPSDIFLLSRPTSAMDASTLQRASRKAVPLSTAHQISSLHGAAAAVEAEAVMPRRSRGRGAASPDMTVQMTRKHVANDGYTSGELREGADSYGLRSYRNLMRPSTAANDTILRHRYSLPDSAPSPLKLDTTRVAKPLVTHSVSADAARSAYMDAAEAYNWNKTKSLYGGRFRMGQ